MEYLRADRAEHEALDRVQAACPEDDEIGAALFCDADDLGGRISDRAALRASIPLSARRVVASVSADRWRSSSSLSANFATFGAR
jgi:hypothetical protein